ncbi:MAG: MFS transporter [Sphingomicrobium sp.]
MNKTETYEPEPATSEEDRVLPGGWYTLGAMLVVTLFAFVDRQLITLAAAPLAVSLHLSDTQLGLVQGLAFTVFTLVALYPLAWAADRFDRRYVLGVCVVLWSLGTAACGFAQNFTQLFTAAVAIAAGEAGLGPISMSIVPDLFKGKKRVLANGVNYFAGYVGIALALALGGAALGALDAMHHQLPSWLSRWESWRLAFFALALPAPLLLMLIAFARLRHSTTAVAIAPAASSTKALFEHLSSHRWAMAWMVSALVMYLVAFAGFLVWLPVVATRLFGTSPAQNGVSMGIATGIGMVGGVLISTIALRFLFARIGQRAPVRVAWLIMLFTTPVLFVLPFVGTSLQLYAGFGLMMLSGTAVGVLVSTILQNMAPAILRARFFAVYSIVATALPGFAPSLVGWLSDSIGGQKSLLYALTFFAVPTWIAATFMLRKSEGPYALLAEETVRSDAAYANQRT